MKHIIYLIAGASLIFATAARADRNDDNLGKSVRCKADHGQTIVQINRARTVISVIDATDPGHPTTYAIDSKDSDGDTFNSYSGHDISPDPDTGITLSFDDQGNTLTYTQLGEEDSAQTIKLYNCK